MKQKAKKPIARRSILDFPGREHLTLEELASETAPAEIALSYVSSKLLNIDPLGWNRLGHDSKSLNTLKNILEEKKTHTEQAALAAHDVVISRLTGLSAVTRRIFVPNEYERLKLIVEPFDTKVIEKHFGCRRSYKEQQFPVLSNEEVAHLTQQFRLLTLSKSADEETMRHAAWLASEPIYLYAHIFPEALYEDYAVSRPSRIPYASMVRIKTPEALIDKAIRTLSKRIHHARIEHHGHMKSWPEKTREQIYRASIFDDYVGMTLYYLGEHVPETREKSSIASVKGIVERHPDFHAVMNIIDQRDDYTNNQTPLRRLRFILEQHQHLLGTKDIIEGRAEFVVTDLTNDLRFNEFGPTGRYRFRHARRNYEIDSATGERIEHSASIRHAFDFFLDQLIPNKGFSYKKPQ